MIYLFGGGGFAREVKAAIMCTDVFLEVVCVVDDGFEDENSIRLSSATSDEFIIAVGDPKTRAKIAKRLKGRLKQSSLCLGALLDENCQVGNGTIIQPGAVITTGVRIGRHVIVNLNATIGHDCNIGDFTTISPGANISGNVTIGKRCYIGSNAVIRERVAITDDVIIGAGSVVLDDILKPGTYVGVPVKRIR